MQRLLNLHIKDMVDRHFFVWKVVFILVDPVKSYNSDITWGIYHVSRFAC